MSCIKVSMGFYVGFLSDTYNIVCLWSCPTSKVDLNLITYFVLLLMAYASLSFIEDEISNHDYGNEK